MAKRAPRGEQTKSESVTARLNPKLKFGLEMLARQQRRSVSAVLETMLERALASSQELDVDQLWHPNEAVRARKLQLSPEGRGLLTYDEAKALEYLPMVLDKQARMNLDAIARGEPGTQEQSILLLALESLWPLLKKLSAQNEGASEEQIALLGKVIPLQQGLLQGRIDANAYKDQFPVLPE